MASSIKPYPVKKIYLDPENPRHESLPNEAAIVAHLSTNESVRQLAKSIAEAGSTSPLDIVALIPHPKVKSGYIVVEGNRRICALKLLDDPDKASDERDKKYFRQLKQFMTKPIVSVPAIVVKDRETAAPWLVLRHGGEQDGVGTKAWNSDQIARFTMRNGGSTPNKLASLIKDYAGVRSILSADELASVSLTTLTRYLSNPVFRAALGLASPSDLLITVPAAEFERALTKFLRDFVNPSTGVGSSRTKATERKAYGEKLIAEGYAPTTRNLPPAPPSHAKDSETPHPPPPDSAEPPTGQAKPTPPKTPRNKQHPGNRKYVVPTSFVAPVNDNVFTRLFTELRRIDAEEFPFAATYLFRSVLEQVVILYLRHKRVPNIPDALHSRLNIAADELVKDGVGQRSRAIKQLRTMSSNVHALHSPDTIGNFVHGGAIPTRPYVLSAWESFEPALVELVSALSKGQ